MALADALGVSPGTILVHAGVREAVLALLQTCQDRSPSASELASLPEWERNHLTQFFAARDELNAATDVLEQVAAVQASAAGSDKVGRHDPPESSDRASVVSGECTLDRADERECRGLDRVEHFQRLVAALERSRIASRSFETARGRMLELAIRLA